MARKKATASNRRATGVKAILNHLPDVSLSGKNERILRRFSRMRSTRLIASGIAAFGLVRLAMRVVDSYPQIGEFFSENLDTVEGKFREWTGREEGSDIADVQH